MNYWDNYYVKVPLGTIYRPAEPVNPLLWFGITGNTRLQRKPQEDERLMCDYVRLAIIHDYELRVSGTLSDSYILGDGYKGKWFERDKFWQDAWAYYHYSERVGEADRYPRGADEKLAQLGRAITRVRADLENQTRAVHENGQSARGEDKAWYWKLYEVTLGVVIEKILDAMRRM
jgi:hypothetical protein